jgi:glycosyltransferase involved in cell wall biosynthesis
MTGIVPVRNGDELDYCWRLAVASLLPVCEEVIISDGESTDGTYEAALALAKEEPKIKVVRWPWPDPVGDHWFLTKWLAWTQQHASYDMICHLDADEVFDPISHHRMRLAVEKREALWFHRINLWKDPQHEAPHGTVCSHLVVYLGPGEHGAVSDNVYPGGNDPEIKAIAKQDPDNKLRIWHLGFLRHKPQFVKKWRTETRYLLNTIDPRCEQCEQTGEDWVELTMWKDRQLIEHGLELPELVRPWLLERGHKL